MRKFNAACGHFGLALRERLKIAHTALCQLEREPTIPSLTRLVWAIFRQLWCSLFKLFGALGIQFAPPVVCAMAWLAISPGSNDHWIIMLWGYGLYQLMLGIRLGKWLGAQPFAPSYWAYTFGIAAATVSGLKLALAGVHAAKLIAIPVFIGANLFIAYLSWRTLRMFLAKRKSD